MVKRKPVVIECYAYLPPIQSAIMVSGDGDLLQAKFNINLSISPEAAKLLMMTGKKLKLTVEETLTDFDVEVEKGTPDEITKSAKGSGSQVDRRRRTNRRDKR